MTVETVGPARFRTVLGHFCTGVTVITTHDGTAPAGFACQSFSALSLEPPLVLFCPAKQSRTWPAIRRAGWFAVNVLAEEQSEVSAAFGARGADKFSSVEWTPAPSGSPVLAGALTWIDCRVEVVHEAGDHYVVVGAVTATGEPSGGRPLLFYRGRYTTAEPERADLGGLLAWAGPDDWL
ncbi:MULTISPECIES: 3-hydroxy-9,10-secoandrosta-1,3,5(10)-triene-9,17-dione monooxygenase reductase subunit [Amycolatopsis]|uniref:3-hydroxy-9,10-secoandrosta-1,3,5(10)-triene-9,17-dione monooxygenase reductase component n=2 Tax=Amycolatopsis TaxID=1813 RepID=A0A1I3W673_9PSEU|nr:3-hydroxy-9,10-secoandrosta-1,3,5(10)-triene-9,17-dione monooxygenase reductase subunit [Amycolatopsis sacchari]SFK01951.1 3-hydroxy-9,10-secoandrosta-1,3,5(10)-triene-9,17-dione monooxygenase reductase component [Amycolatopsis sacchari]